MAWWGRESSRNGIVMQRLVEWSKGKARLGKVKQRKSSVELCMGIAMPSKAG